MTEPGVTAGSVKSSKSDDAPDNVESQVHDSATEKNARANSEKLSKISTTKVAAHIKQKKAPDQRGANEGQNRKPLRNSKAGASNPLSVYGSRVLSRPSPRGSASATAGDQTRTGSSGSKVVPEESLKRSRGCHDDVKKSTTESSSLDTESAAGRNEQIENWKEISPGGGDADKVHNHTTAPVNEILVDSEKSAPKKKVVFESEEGENAPVASELNVNKRAESVLSSTGEKEHRGSPVSLQETENIRPRNYNTPEPERPQNAHLSNTADIKNHAFMDGFDTKEQPWKPGKKVVDHTNERPRNEYKWKSSRKSIPGMARKATRSQEWRSEDPPVSRKGPAGRDLVAAQLQREFDPFGNPMNGGKSSWHPGKGRGNGPVPPEWIPPFRSGATPKSEGEESSSSKEKSARRRYSDEWLPLSLLWIGPRPGIGPKEPGPALREISGPLLGAMEPVLQSKLS